MLQSRRILQSGSSVVAYNTYGGEHLTLICSNDFEYNQHLCN